jgi:hypothetical protein
VTTHSLRKETLNPEFYTAFEFQVRRECAERFRLKARASDRYADVDVIVTQLWVVTPGQTNVPGDSVCELCVFDQDVVGSDDLIGSTKLDIENRWLNDKWKVVVPCF